MKMTKMMTSVILSLNQVHKIFGLLELGSFASSQQMLWEIYFWHMVTLCPYI